MQLFAEGLPGGVLVPPITYTGTRGTLARKYKTLPGWDPGLAADVDKLLRAVLTQVLGNTGMILVDADAKVVVGEAEIGQATANNRDVGTIAVGCECGISTWVGPMRGHRGLWAGCYPKSYWCGPTVAVPVVVGPACCGGAIGGPVAAAYPVPAYSARQPAVAPEPVVRREPPP